MPGDADGPESSYVLARWLFLRLLAAVYLIAFASLAVQVSGLLGEHGILPAGRYLEWARSLQGGRAYRLLPTLFWLGAGDTALRLVAWGGAVLAAVALAGPATAPVFALLWVLYLSLTAVGQEFLSFQWDALLLEAGLLACLYAPLRWWPGRAASAPSPLARWLLLWLLFRLMFLSGATKLLSGDPTWRHLTALDYHFETQPLPPWTAWYAHHLSAGVHRAATLGMFAVELLVPWLVLAPSRARPVRLAAFALLVLFQLSLAATGNYGFFNLLTIVLCVPLLDDAVLGRVLPVRVRAEPRVSGLRHRVMLAVTPVILLLTALSFVRELAYTLPAGRGLGLVPGWGERLLEAVAPLRSFNGYGLFRVMTTERPEIVIEGSRDGKEWKEYQFRWKPGAIGRRPGFVAPYHPRLDWQMWFAALDPVGASGWLRRLMQQLLAGAPEVLSLLNGNPFPDSPPRYIRLAYYHYRFSSPAERASTGAWWVRELAGYLTEPDSR